MRKLSLLLVLALVLMLSTTAFAQDGPIMIDLLEQNDSGITGTATLEDNGDGTTRVDLVLEGVAEDANHPAHIHAGACPEPGEVLYPLENVVFNANAGAGVSVTQVDATLEEILADPTAINVHLSPEQAGVYVACGNLVAAGDDQQDDQQTGGGGDQQGGGGASMVTKTFELTLNGDVPADAAFVAGYLEEGQDPDTEGRFVILCGDLSQIPPEEIQDIPDEDIISDEACVGNVYSFERDFAQGTNLAFFFARASVTDEEFFEIFHTSLQNRNLDEPPGPGDFETLNTDFTNTAWYTFTGAGDVQDDQQDDQQGGGGDDQQDEDLPEAMPETGAGGMAGTGLPIAQVAAAVSLLAAGAYGVRRRY